MTYQNTGDKMRYATLRQNVYARRSEYWRRVRRAADNNRLAAALEHPWLTREDAPVGVMALGGPLFGRPGWQLDVLDIWWEDHGDGRGKLFLPQSGGGRRAVSRTTLAQIVMEAGRADRAPRPANRKVRA